MVQKKTPASAEAAVIALFRKTHTVHAMNEALQSEAYLVPKIVKDMGQVIGLWSDAIFAEWGDSNFNAELLDAYRELATTTSQLLSWFSVDAVSGEAVASVTHRLAANVQPLVSLHSRVDHLYRSFMQDEAEHVQDDVQKLWASLEFRAVGVTGKTLAQILKDA